MIWELALNGRWVRNAYLVLEKEFQNSEARFYAV